MTFLWSLLSQFMLLRLSVITIAFPSTVAFWRYAYVGGLDDPVRSNHQNHVYEWWITGVGMHRTGFGNFRI